MPNILSAFRIALVPVFWIAYMTDHAGIKQWAVVVYALAAFTDFLDGFIARKFQLVTKLGKILDPAGDKLMQASALACIAIDGIIPGWAVVAVVVKEALMGVGGIIVYRTKTEMPPSNILGKAATVVFIAVCLALMIFTVPQSIAQGIIAAAIALMFMAFGSYLLLFISVMKKKNNQ